MPLKLSTFGFNDLMECRTALRDLGNHPFRTQEEAARAIVDYFYRNLVDDNGDPACALVRLFKTHPFALLDNDLQTVARRTSADVDHVTDLRCLVLLATAGLLPAWNSRHESAGHRAIPLTSEQMVEQAPMITQLIRQFGLKLSTVLKPEPSMLLEASGSTFNVFYVPVAEGSPYIPSQETFVKKYGVASVLGTGGMSATGDMFALILFSRVPISSESADHFKVVGLNVRSVLLPQLRKPLF